MKSIFSIFKRGLEKTTTKVARTIGSIVTGVKAHNAESFDELEELREFALTNGFDIDELEYPPQRFCLETP